MIETRAPGKLFIVGEYAVVEPGEPAVLVAVDRYLRVRLTELPAQSAANPESMSDHVRAATRAIDELRRERGLPERFFSIETESELDEADGRKYGLGSSAAVTVAAIEALDKLYGLGLSALERFKLALLATIEISPKASGGDLAASTFGGWVRYTSPDRDALRLHREAHGITSTLESELWQGYHVRRLPAPADLRLLVGWTGSPASTEALVSRAAAGADAADSEFLAASRACADALCGALLGTTLKGSTETALTAIRQARTLLLKFGEDRGTVIETEMLTALCDSAEQHGAVAKSSGAGGGDCGIALAPRGSDIEGILREWQKLGITPLNLEVAAGSPGAEGDADER